MISLSHKEEALNKANYKVTITSPWANDKVLPVPPLTIESWFQIRKNHRRFAQKYFSLLTADKRNAISCCIEIYRKKESCIYPSHKKYPSVQIFAIFALCCMTIAFTISDMSHFVSTGAFWELSFLRA